MAIHSLWLFLSVSFAPVLSLSLVRYVSEQVNEFWISVRMLTFPDRLLPEHTNKFESAMFSYSIYLIHFMRDWCAI